MSMDMQLAADTVAKIVKRMEAETASLVESHGSGFASSVMASACAQVAGMALALVEDDDIREAGKLAFMLAMDHAADQSVALFEAFTAIDKAKQ
jgi:hypothetical protein